MFVAPDAAATDDATKFALLKLGRRIKLHRLDISRIFRHEANIAWREPVLAIRDSVTLIRNGNEKQKKR